LDIGVEASFEGSNRKLSGGRTENPSQTLLKGIKIKPI